MRFFEALGRTMSARCTEARRSKQVCSARVAMARSRPFGGGRARVRGSRMTVRSHERPKSPSSSSGLVVGPVLKSA